MDVRPRPGDVELAKAQILAATGKESFTSDFIGLLEAGEACLHRLHRPGHLTGSAFVIQPDRGRCLLLFHRKLQRWLQPGGHADGDGNLAHVALREAEEETGIDGLCVFEPAIDLDVHRVESQSEDSHVHFDVRFVVTAPTDASAVGNHESEALRWVGWDELVDYGADEGLLRLARSTRRALLG